jgi:hypothetical protein
MLGKRPEKAAAGKLAQTSTWLFAPQEGAAGRHSTAILA